MQKLKLCTKYHQMRIPAKFGLNWASDRKKSANQNRNQGKSFCQKLYFHT
jgi:hypothetical protein